MMNLSKLNRLRDLWCYYMHEGIMNISGTWNVIYYKCAVCQRQWEWRGE